MLKGHTDCVWCVATCTASGRVLAVSGSQDHSVRIWDVGSVAHDEDDDDKEEEEGEGGCSIVGEVEAMDEAEV